MRFILAGFSVFLGFFVVISSRPTEPGPGPGTKEPSSPSGDSETSELAESRNVKWEPKPFKTKSKAEYLMNSFLRGAFKVDNKYESLKRVSDYNRILDVSIEFVVAAGWNNRAALEEPESIAYAKTNALLLLQLSEPDMKIRRPYRVGFVNLSPSSTAHAMQNGFKLKFKLRDSVVSAEINKLQRDEGPRGLLFKRKTRSLFTSPRRKKDLMRPCKEYLNGITYPTADT